MLALIYVIHGDLERVRLPTKLAPARADGLWQHTCFEAFVRSANSAGYWEFNFSPSRQWAAYRFSGYREGMTPEAAVASPRIEMQADHSKFRLAVGLDLSDISEIAASDDWQVALSAVVEDASGDKSYWASAHPPGRPDFHHPDSFALHLPA